MSTAENGVVLVSAESQVPGLCTLGIMSKLGPRFENYDNAGVSQVRQKLFTSYDLVKLSTNLTNWALGKWHFLFVFHPPSQMAAKQTAEATMTH